MSALHRSVETITCPDQLTAFLNNTMGLELDHQDTEVLKIALNRNGGKGLSMGQIRNLVDTNDVAAVSVLSGGDDLLESYFTKAEEHQQNMSSSKSTATDVIASIFHKAEQQTPMSGGAAKDFNTVSLFSDTDLLKAGNDSVSEISLFSDVSKDPASKVSLFTEEGAAASKVSLFTEEPDVSEEPKVSLFTEEGPASKVSLVTEEPEVSLVTEKPEVSLFTEGGAESKVSLFTEEPEVAPASKVSLFTEEPASKVSLFSDITVRGGGDPIPTFSVDSEMPSKLPQLRTGSSNTSSSFESSSYADSSNQTTDYMSAKSRMRRAIENKYRVV